MSSEETITFKDGHAGRLRLNHPTALHALTLTMVRDMTAALLEWKDDPEVGIILIDHAQGRGFCAGGDVVNIATSALGHGAAGEAFFYQEYRMNHLMYTYGKNGVVFMDGITMGGGVGISCPCKYRIATENTVFAMPETGIGLFPDVGGGRYLSRIRGRFAQYLALTAGRLTGADCFALRLATHYIPSAALEEVKAKIAANPDDVQAILDDASVEPPEAKILEREEEINRLFASDTIEDIVAALDAEGSEWATKQASIIRTKSPLACKVSLKLLVESPKLDDFADQMKLEFGIIQRVFRYPDFYEGVRALLIEKDNKPQWQPSSFEDVTPQMVDAFFAPLPAKYAWSPLPDVQ